MRKIPKKGFSEISELKEKILVDSAIAASDSLSMYSEGSCPKPGTLVDRVALQAYLIAILTSNPNAVDTEMFRGAANREKDYISMIANLFGKKEGDSEQDAFTVIL